MLDGAGHNAPDLSDVKDSEEPKKPKIDPNAPPQPNEKDDPVGALRWYLMFSPKCPGSLRQSQKQIEEHCQRLQKQHDAGNFKWDDSGNRWVPAVKGG